MTEPKRRESSDTIVMSQEAIRSAIGRGTKPPPEVQAAIAENLGVGRRCPACNGSGVVPNDVGDAVEDALGDRSSDIPDEPPTGDLPDLEDDEGDTR